MMAERSSSGSAMPCPSSSVDCRSPLSALLVSVRSRGVGDWCVCATKHKSHPYPFPHTPLPPGHTLTLHLTPAQGIPPPAPDPAPLLLFPAALLAGPGPGLLPRSATFLLVFVVASPSGACVWTRPLPGITSRTSFSPTSLWPAPWWWVRLGGPLGWSQLPPQAISRWTS